MKREAKRNRFKAKCKARVMHTRKGEGVTPGNAPAIAAPSAASAPYDGRMYHPAFGRTVKYKETLVPDDPDGQVFGTLRLMQQYICEDALSPEIQDEARRVRAAGAQDETAIAERCWEWVRSRVRFVDDSALYSLVPSTSEHPAIETLIRPRDMAVMGDGRRQGDCDDFSMYLACLLAACGVDCKLVTVAAEADQPRNFSHVYVAAYPRSGSMAGQRFPLDASHGDYPGWETERRLRIMEHAITGSSMLALLALGLIGYVCIASGIVE